MGGLNQIDRTAAEAAASQSRSEHAWQRPRQLDHQVQLGTTDFVIIAEAQMRFIHQRAEAIEIPLLEGHRGFLDSCIFADDVTAATVHQLWQLARV